VAHRAISRQHRNSVAFGAKRTLSPIYEASPRGNDFSGSFSLQFCDHYCDQRVPSTLAVIAQPIFSVAVASTPERPVLAELGSQCLGF
jgi:hypothetical protein